MIHNTFIYNIREKNCHMVIMTSFIQTTVNISDLKNRLDTNTVLRTNM